MSRNWSLVGPASFVFALTVVLVSAIADDETEAQFTKLGQRLQALKKQREADRCPGETAADRNEPTPSPGIPRPIEETKATISDEGDPALPDHPLAAPDVGGGKPLAPGEFSPEMLKLKGKLRETLGWYYDHPQKVNDRSPWGIMHWLIPFGVDSYVIDAKGQRQNTIGYLCFNYPCKGQRLFYLDKKKELDAMIGPGVQGHKGQFLAMLAQSKVSSEYPMKVEGKDFTIADLIEYEKRTCEAGTELTFKLIALTHYLKHGDKWKNTKGEEWDLPRLIREELKQPVVGAACGGTHRMTGFSFAVRKHQARGLILDGQWERSRDFIDRYHEYTYTLQNRDGSFSTNWFQSKGDQPDSPRRLQTSGHILEWLVYSLPEADLQDKQVVRGVEYLTELLANGKATKWEIGPLGHALHALALYDERVFGGKPGHRAEELARKPGNEVK
jgi:hypothetical protein